MNLSRERSQGGEPLSGTDRVLLLTNDDGLDAPGLAALREAAEALGQLRVIAPCGPFSGCGHRVTTDGPIVVARRTDGRYAVEGTPADCVRLALHHLAPGGDLGALGDQRGWEPGDRRPPLRDRRGGPRGCDPRSAGDRASRTTSPEAGPSIGPGPRGGRRRCSASSWTQARGSRARFWNVNLPHPEPGGPDPAVVFCPLDPSPLPLRYRVEGDVGPLFGRLSPKRARRPESDVDVCFRGQIAVSLVRVMPPARECERRLRLRTTFVLIRQSPGGSGRPRGREVVIIRPSDPIRVPDQIAAELHSGIVMGSEPSGGLRRESRCGVGVFWRWAFAAWASWAARSRPISCRLTPPGAVVDRTPASELGDKGPQALGEQRATAAVAGSEPKPAVAKAEPAPPTAKGEVKTTSTGLKYETLKPGTGAEVKAGQTVTVSYKGTLDDGTTFDQSREKAELPDRGGPGDQGVGSRALWG